MSYARFDLDTARLAFETSPAGMCGDALRRAAATTVHRAQLKVQMYGRIRTGAMLASIGHSQVTGGGGYLDVTVYVLPSYSSYQHFGTRYIAPAPFLKDAADLLTTADF